MLDLELVSGTLAPKLQIAIVRDVPRARINERTAAARFWESCTMFACSPPMFPEWPVTTIELAVRNCGASFAIAVLDLGLTSAVPSLKYATVGSATATTVSLGTIVPSITFEPTVDMILPLLRNTTCTVQRPVLMKSKLWPAPKHTVGVSGLIRYVFACSTVRNRIADFTICEVPKSAVVRVDEGVEATAGVVTVEVAKVFAVVVVFELPAF